MVGIHEYMYINYGPGSRELVNKIVSSSRPAASYFRTIGSSSLTMDGRKRRLVSNISTSFATKSL